jgi:3-oxoadipate enol-lactonase
MPTLRVKPDLLVHYEDEDFADPWESHETFVLLHGFAESSVAWYAWVPQLARRYRVVRPDLRGFGRSTVPDDPAGFPWSVRGFADDVVALLDALALERVHLVGARVGAPVAMQLAADHPGRVGSLSLVSGLARGEDVRGLRAGGEVVALSSFAEQIRREGLEAWFARSGRARLGSAATDAQVTFWSRLMARSDPEVCIAMMNVAPRLDVLEALARIQAPTLVLASSESQVQRLEATRAWQSQIGRSELRVLPGDSPHLAATDADACATAVIEFVQRLRPLGPAPG